MTAAEAAPLSYHDLHITTPTLPRTRLSALRHGYDVVCSRVGGWQVWYRPSSGGSQEARLVAGEFDGETAALRIDVAGHVIVDTMTGDTWPDKRTPMYDETRVRE